MKFIADSNIKIIQIISIEVLSKKPILLSCVEKPPIAIVEKLCPIASNKFIPAKKYERAQRKVRPR